MLTDKTIRGFTPKAKAYRVTERAQRRGFGSLVVEVDPSSSKYFLFRYSFGGKRRMLKVGTFKERHRSEGITLAQARDKIDEYRHILTQENQDPKVFLQRKLEKEQAVLRANKAQGTFRELLTQYLQYLKEERRGHNKIEYSLRHYVMEPFPHLLDKPANEITVDDIRKILGRMAQKGITTSTNRTRSHLHAAFGHAVRYENDYERLDFDLKFNITYNPVSVVPRKQKFENVGNHVISEDDIRTVWHLSKTEMAPVMRCLILIAFATGGQRPSELAQVEWKQVDAKRQELLIQAHISKNKSDHLVPLNALAMELFSELHEMTGHLVYPFAGEVGSGWADKHIISTSISRATSRFHANNPEAFERWVPRDIRRTCKTHMGAAGINKDIRDKIANHAMNADVSARHYDRYDYLKEKRKALDIWNDYLVRIIQPPEPREL